MRHRLASAIVLALATGQAFAATTELPRTVRPSHYDVAITPHAQSLDFAGRVVVAIEVLEPTATITLHARDLAFSKVVLGADGQKREFAATKTGVDADAQTATFTFPETIRPGTYRLAMDYTGKIGRQAAGLFAMDYDTAAGKK